MPTCIFTSKFLLNKFYIKYQNGTLLQAEGKGNKKIMLGKKVIGYYKVTFL